MDRERWNEGWNGDTAATTDRRVMLLISFITRAETYLCTCAAEKHQKGNTPARQGKMCQQVEEKAQ